MHDLLHKTGPYLHAPDDLLRLRYETGGTPRLFSLLIASAVERDGIDHDGAGIVILDEDEWQVLLDRHRPETKARIGDELYRIRSMSWESFSGFCRSHPRFRGGPDDIVTPHESPLPGSRHRQATRPELLEEASPAGEGDLRSALMIRAASDPTCPVTFPARDRPGMLADLRHRVIRAEQGGPFLLGWDIPLSSTPAPSGLGERPVDRAFDPMWEELVESRPELIEEARCEVLVALATSRISTFGATDEGRYDLRIVATGEGPALGLHGLDEQALTATTAQELLGRVASLENRDLRDLWKLSRTLDLETGPERVAVRFQAALNKVRAETEAARDADPSPSGP